MRRIALTFATVAIALCSHAQLLWKVSGNGLTQPSYLFGTHHIAPISLLDSVPGFNDALASVTEVYGEIEMTKMNTPEAMTEIQKRMMAPADSTLSKVFSPVQLDSIDSVLKKYSGGMITVAALEPLSPAAIATQLAMLQNMQAFPEYNPTEQLDMTIQMRGAALGKAIKGLETLEYQMNVLFGAPISVQAESLMKSIRDNDAIDAVRTLAAAFLAGDLKKIDEYMTDPTHGMTEAEAERLLYERNDNWTNLLLGILPTASVLVAVGVGHLPGEKGLIMKLREKGFDVTPVK